MLMPAGSAPGSSVAERVPSGFLCTLLLLMHLVVIAANLQRSAKKGTDFFCFAADFS